MAESDGKRIDAALIERWALGSVERFPSSAANLRRVLLRRVRRHAPDDRGAEVAAVPLVDELVARLQRSGVVDDAAYAAARASSRLRRGQSLRTIRAGLAAKGIGAEDAAAAIAALSEDGGTPDLVAATAFARRRRLGPFRGAGEADRERELAAFARAGFSRTAAEAVLSCADPDEAAALAASGLA